MVRLILAILALLVSLPATACHAAPMAAAMGHAHHAPKPPAVADAHVCVGCAPLGDWLRAPLTAPLAARDPAPIAWVAALDLGKTGPPALPPPRLA